MLKVGDKFPTWFSNEIDGMSTILEIYPYHSNVKENKDTFHSTLLLTAPKTRKRSIEMAVSKFDMGIIE